MIHRRLVTRSLQQTRLKSQASKSLFLNPHEWQGLPADQIFELHNLRKDELKENYNPTDEERNAILSTMASLRKTKPTLDYVYEIDNFKERYMNNTPVNQRGLPPKLSNVNVISKGATPHELRRRDQLLRVSAFEMPLLAKYREAYVAKSNKETPLKLTYNTDFSDDSNSVNRQVTLTVQLADLDLNEKQQKKFMILAGNKFNHNTKTLRFSVGELPEATQNARLVVERFSKLLAQSKDLTDDFSDIPIDTRHTKPKKTIAKFPKEWSRPQDAPAPKHAIVQRLVDDFKSKKDQEYIAKISP